MEKALLEHHNPSRIDSKKSSRKLFVVNIHSTGTSYYYYININMRN